MSTKSSASVVHGAFGPSSLLTTGAPHSAAKRIACLRYSVPISGRTSGVCADSPDSFTPACAGPFHPERIVEHGDAVEVAGLAEQLAAPVDHRLDVLVAQRRGLLDTPLERLVFVPHELQVDAD